MSSDKTDAWVKKVNQLGREMDEEAATLHPSAWEDQLEPLRAKWLKVAQAGNGNKSNADQISDVNMTNYHVIGVMERNGQRQAIDQHLAADNAKAAIESFEADGWHWVLGKVTVLRLPCVDGVLYERQVALARAEISEVMAKPGQMTQMELFPSEAL